uniref:Uncharacterized protein n=1 Tax=Arundo donax TaxID=35708 RepID=A0A0A8Z980_ARUDO
MTSIFSEVMSTVSLSKAGTQKNILEVRWSILPHGYCTFHSCIFSSTSS